MYRVCVCLCLCEYADGDGDDDDDAELSRDHFIQKKNNWPII